MKVFVPKFSRSENAVGYLMTSLDKADLLTVNIDDADYIIAVGDRCEMFDYTLEAFRANIPIIHLWAGEISQGTHDEVYRHSITLMSQIQLCTNDKAKNRVEALCKAVDKKSEAYVVGNLMLDDMDLDDSITPKYPYILVLYNPPTNIDRIEILQEIESIHTFIKDKGLPYVWIEPNGDQYGYLVREYVNMPSRPRPQFLSLIKNCKYFITNSSCQYYEAPFLISPEQIISIGERNAERESKYANMGITGATRKIIAILENLK